MGGDKPAVRKRQGAKTCQWGDLWESCGEDFAVLWDAAILLLGTRQYGLVHPGETGRSWKQTGECLGLTNAYQKSMHGRKPKYCRIKKKIKLNSFKATT